MDENKSSKTPLKRAALHNLGCKVNAYENDIMRRALEEKGYTIVPFEDVADVYVINTCTVTNTADQKSRQMIHRAKKKNPDAIVVAAGCYAQMLSKKDDTGGADICIGNGLKDKIGDILEEADEKRRIFTEDEESAAVCGSGSLDKIKSHTRAYIKVQDGCSQYCTYCIIPYARGRVRSRKEEDILKEIKALSETGVREFVITGIHLSSYGSDFDRPGKIVPADCFGKERLLHLLKNVAAVEGVERIRLGSLEPRIMDEEFVKGLADIGKICPHFHLSLQSGSDTVLKRMNRHYTTADFTECADNLRKYFNDPALTTDVITGFPGETEEEFKETLAFAEKTGFYEMHIFRYSRREGTPAAAMKGQLSNAVKAKRSDSLEALGKRLKADYIKRFAGREQEVLFEEIKEDDKGIMRAEGYTSRYIRLSVPAGDLEGFKPGMTAYAVFDCTDGEEPVEAYVV